METKINNEILNFNKICRICLSDKGKMNKLFDSCLDKMLLCVAKIQAEQNDGLPQLICFQCVLQVSRTFRFKNLCEKSDKYLREYVKSSSPVENSEPEIISQNDQNMIANQTVDDFETILVDKCDDCVVVNNSDQQSKVTDKLFECQVCSKVFAKRKILQRHLKIHNSEKSFKCSDCGKAFAESSNLNKHKKVHTGELRNVIGKPNLCSICGKSFKWKSSLHKHSKYHTKNKIHKCSLCPKFYAEIKSLNIHLRSHSGEKPFTCNFCKKAFTQSSSLKTHLRIHSGEKPFQCKICNKRFSQNGYLGIHMRTHTGEKPYQCPECGKCFAGSNSLNIHMKIHSKTGEFLNEIENCTKELEVTHKDNSIKDSIFYCDFCEEVFESLATKTKHMEEHPTIFVIE